MDGDPWHCTGDRIQDHPQEKKCKKAKCLSEEALQIAVKIRHVKSKAEKERYQVKQKWEIPREHFMQRWAQ